MGADESSPLDCEGYGATPEEAARAFARACDYHWHHLGFRVRRKLHTSGNYVYCLLRNDPIHQEFPLSFDRRGDVYRCYWASPTLNVP